MARRGRCRCGCAIMAWRKADGYKTRCPGCQSVVRLGTLETKGRRRARHLRKTTCSCGAVVVVDAWPLACPCCSRQLLVPPAYPDPPAPPSQLLEKPSILDLFEESRPTPPRTSARAKAPPPFSDAAPAQSIESPLVQRVLTALTAPVRAASRWLRDS